MSDKPCSISGCERSAKARGWCQMHWHRWWLHGNPNTVLRNTRKTEPQKPCAFLNCDRTAQSRGWCYLHYDRWRKHGDPNKTLRNPVGANNLRKLHKDELQALYDTAGNACILGRQFGIGGSTALHILSQAGVSVRRKGYRIFGQKRGAESPGWRGGRNKTPGGYILLLVGDHPSASKKGYILEHRLVMERKLGRYLLPNETVHHLNGIRDDNRPENLELWGNRHPKGQRVHVRQHCLTCTCFQKL